MFLAYPVTKGKKHGEEEKIIKPPAHGSFHLLLHPLT
jgi:hypothetical protein